MVYGDFNVVWIVWVFVYYLEEFLVKKISIVSLFVIIALSLIACEPRFFYFDLQEMKDNVEKVELIKYTNDEAKEVMIKRAKFISFNFDKMEILESLPNEKLYDFLQELADFPFMSFNKCLNSPQGICIRVKYKNEDFDVISCFADFSGGYNADGTFKRFIGEGISFYDNIIQFFETQIQ